MRVGSEWDQSGIRVGCEWDQSGMRVGSEWDHWDIMNDSGSNTWQILTQKWDGSGMEVGFFLFWSRGMFVIFWTSFQKDVPRARCPQGQMSQS